MKHAPSIFINGLRLACEFDNTGSTAVVLDGIEIDWGRDELYDSTNPSSLRIFLLDPSGSFASAPTLFGSPITVETDLGVLFRGRIDEVIMEPDEVSDPNPAVPPDVWLVTISATDVIADLAKIVAPGYEATITLIAEQVEAYHSQYGVGYWWNGNSETRRAAIQSRMASLGMTTKVETTDYATISPPGVAWYKYFYEGIRRATDTLYTMIQSVQLRSDSPVHTNYLPDRDVLVAAKFARTASFVLTYAAGVIDAKLNAAGGPAFTIPCATIEIDPPAPVNATVAHNIGSLRIHQANYASESHLENGNSFGVQIWNEAAVSTPVGNAQGATTQWELLPVEVGSWNLTWQGDSGPTASQTAADLAAVLAPIVASVNGKLMPPPLIFDIEANTYGAAVEAALIATWTIDAPFSFPGARYEALTGWGPAFQMIGGTLNFDQGWRATVQFAPSPSTRGTLTISQLVTTDPPLLNQYATTVSLATLGAVSGGI